MSASNRVVAAAVGAVIGVALSVLPSLAGAQTGAPVPLVPSAQNQTPPPLSAPVNSQASRAIAVGVLEELGIERVGLMDDSSGALPNAMWDGSDPDLVRAVLSQLPRRMPSLATRTVAHHLLLPAARQPRERSDRLDVASDSAASVDTVVDPMAPGRPWLLEARIAALSAMGDWPNVNALLELVPAERLSEPLVRARIDALLLAGTTDIACAEGQAALARRPDVQWQKLQVYCQFAGKQTSAAQLGLSLLREQGLDDAIFFWAADVLQGQKVAAPANLQRLPPLELVMLRAAGRTFPDSLARSDDPTVLRVWAAMPQTPLEEEKLNAAQRKERIKQQQESRLLVSERAVALGVLDAEMLRARYLDFDISQDAKPITLAEATADNLRARVMMYQNAHKQTDPKVRAEMINRAIDLSRTDRGQRGPDVVTVGRVYAPMLAEITPSPELLWFAGNAGRGLLAAGMREKAQAWFDMVRQMSRGSIEATGIAENFWPIDHLAFPNNRSVLTPRNLRAWQASLPAEAGLLSRQSLLTLLSAVGDPVTASEWLPVLKSLPPPSVATMPQPAIWQALSLAAREAKAGEATAFGLAALGDSGPHAAAQSTLHKVIESLVMVGREDDARLIATEAALVQGL
jgi:hypothetical protein